MTPSQRSRALCLWACSGFIFFIQIRTFSNSTEAVLLAVLLVCVKRVSMNVFEPSQSTQSTERVPSNTSRAPLGPVFGIILALGTFTRVTFIPFALPTVLAFVYLSWLPLRALPRAKQGTRLLFRLFAILCAFLTASVVFILVDTAYYSTFLPVTTGLAPFSLSSIKLTPLNLLRYNLSTSNLALHGIHPRWLHFVINLPMVVGVSAFGVCGVTLMRFITLERKKMNKGGSPSGGNVDDFMQRIYLATIFAGTAIISLAPHQEPRFLAPLALPSMLVFCPALLQLSPKVSKALIIGHVIQSIILTILFSKLHQAGLLPALFELNMHIRAIAEPTCGTVPALWPQQALPIWFDRESKSKLVIVFWKTFPPVRHLLLPPRTLDKTSNLGCEVEMRQPSQVVMDIIDLMGAPTEQVTSQIMALNFKEETVVLLISPSYAIKQLKEKERDIVLSPPLHHFGPHVHMDDLGVALAMGAEGFKLEVRKIKI